MSVGRRIAAALTLALLMGVAPSAARAYVLIRATASSSPLKWPAASQPVMMRLNDQIGPSLPNVEAGSDPVGALMRALAKFPAVSGFRFQSGSTAIQSRGSDGVNLISFANTAANRQAFEMAGGNAVVGLTLSFSSGSNIVEADVIFNPLRQFSTLRDSDQALDEGDLVDIEAVATHELGHAIGLHHTGVQSGTMWPLTSVLQRTLERDDIAGARVLYPSGSGRGSIFGHVLVNGGGAFGAQVVAIDDQNAVAASTLTLPDGGYTIEQLDPGMYQVYVEPLDGPHSSVPNVACIRVGNLSGAGIYSNATLTTNFPTRFMSDVVVNAGAATDVDFALPAGAPPVNPAQIGTATKLPGGGLTATINAQPIGVEPGAALTLVVAGTNVDQLAVSDLEFGPAVTIDSETFQQVAFTCNGAPLPAFLVDIGIAASVASGAHSLFFAAGGEVVALTGALRVLAPDQPTPTPTTSLTPTTSPTPTSSATTTVSPTPTATVPPTLSPTQTVSPTPGGCVGDCDGLGTVTVDELVKGVNIALGNASVDDCPSFDINDDEAVTVDELVAAVNAALNGCV